MKIFGITFTYNESRMVPYVMKYAENVGFDKLIVYDNQSTDNTVELLKQYNFVEVRELNTNGSKSNSVITDIKNSAWKEFDKEDGWIFIGDFDEVIYFNGNIKEYLGEKGNEGYNYLNQDMIETYCENFPDESKYVHECCNGGSFWGNTSTGGCKMTLFKAGTFKNIEYSPGAHRVKTKTNSGVVIKSLNGMEIKSFHIKHIDHEYCLERKKIAKRRRGPDDIKKGYGRQYEITDEEFERRWNSKIRNLQNINDLINYKKEDKNISFKINIEKESIIEKSIESMYGGVNFRRKVIRKIK